MSWGADHVPRFSLNAIVIVPALEEYAPMKAQFPSVWHAKPVLSSVWPATRVRNGCGTPQMPPLSVRVDSVRPVITRNVQEPLDMHD
jgi:hypothetical protein